MSDNLREAKTLNDNIAQDAYSSTTENIAISDINEETRKTLSRSNLIPAPKEANERTRYRGYINIFNFYHHIPLFKPLGQKLKTDEFQAYFKRAICITLLILYSIYLALVLMIPSKKETSDYWCNGDGFLIINTLFYGSLLLYFQVMKPFLKKLFFSGTLRPLLQKMKINVNIKQFKIFKSILMVGSYIIFIIVDTAEDYSRLTSLLGIFVLVFIGAIFSQFPFMIRWDSIITGIWLQMVFGLAALRWSVGKNLFRCLGKKVSTLLSFTDAGTKFAIGSFLDKTDSYAFKILPVILYFGMLISILYHFGIIQWVIIKLGWILDITMGTTPCESMATAANMFLGQSEAPLVIRPYVSMLTNSELHAVLTGGFATVAGGILAAYISFGVDPSHLLSASIMSAPAALAMSKLFYPETEHSTIDKETIQILAPKRTNVIQAIMDDMIANLPLVANITGVLIIILAGTTFLNSVVDWFCQLLDFEEGVCNIEGFLGILFFPLAWLIGVPWDDCYFVGRLLGVKVFITEFLAYKELGERFREGLVSPRAVVITTYALCGFSSIASMGCQMGALGCFAPSRINDIASLLFRSLIAGNFACLLTACVAGTLIHEPAMRLSVMNGTLIG